MTTYITDKEIDAIAESLADQLEHGNLYSDSPVRDIVPYVIEELQDRKLPTRKSLASLIAKVVKLKWHARIVTSRYRYEANLDLINNKAKG